MEMFCIECGKKIPDNARFCMYCGKPLDISEEYMNGGITEVIDEQREDTVATVCTEKKCEYVVVRETALVTDLLNGERLASYKEKNLNNNKFVFKIGEYNIEYPEEIVTYINTSHFFLELEDRLKINFVKMYLERVGDMESFYYEGIDLFKKTHKAIAESTLQLLIASGIMTVSVDEIEERLPLFHKRLQDVMGQLLEVANDIDCKAQTEMNIREMNSMMSTNSGYIGDGFGFSGMLGGILAAEVVNTAANSLRKMNTDRANNRTKRELNVKPQIISGKFRRLFKAETPVTFCG